MKNKLMLLLAIVGAVFLIGCCKENQKSVVYPDFAMLKVGNYWIYQYFDIDSLGNATATNTYDSCYVEKDTTINGKTYYKIYKPRFEGDPTGFDFERDSLHYIVSATEGILFSSEDFSSTFETKCSINNLDTVCTFSGKMMNKGQITSTPAGNFFTADFQTTFTMFPPYSSGGKTRKTHSKRSEGFGVVEETLSFFADDPNYKERRLVRYNVQ
ncbi:MAG: hypothetical protein U0T32_02595 [Chitinophagales bacterium]